ncbi:hemolysin family protein [Croceibacterium ferulae]|uniref:hemolysin family protein n=1 Tax=Croceibacterium ferulae TaxID=1854641 RepID=UPI000EAE4CA4|nr:hemolysin family protein [Croceibacterium ferulae]
MTDVLLPIIVIIGLILANGVFVAAEFALVGARRSRLQTLSDGGSAPARWMLRVFDREGGKDAYIAVAQLGITLASVGLGMYGEPAVAAWLYGPFASWGFTEDQAHSVGFVVALGGITYLHVVLGEMIPKALALQVPEQVSVTISPVMRAFSLLFRPAVYLLNQIAFGLMRLLGIPDPGRGAMLYTSKELEIATGEVAESGQFEEAQRTLIENIFEMEDRTAEQLMTSRTRMQALPLDMSANEVAARIASGASSRYPVYDRTLDDIQGVLHVKDFIRARVTRQSETLNQLIRPLPRVAATTSAVELLALFKAQHLQAALVVDEFSGTLGFVTMDDLVEDLIERDEGSDWIRKLPDGALLLDGEVSLAELSEDHGLVFDSADVVTIAGLLLSVHGTMPAQGDSFASGGHQLRVEEVRGLKITRIRVEPRRDQGSTS